MGKIFYIMGKSSSGKDSIYRQLEGNQELGLKRLVIYTTRPIRDGEENGREYFFADENKLKEFRRNGKLIEARTYQTVYGPWTYFTADDGQVSVRHGRGELTRQDRVLYADGGQFSPAGAGRSHFHAGNDRL